MIIVMLIKCWIKFRISWRSKNPGWVQLRLSDLGEGKGGIIH
jgi:hypothetical protein